MFGVPPVLRLVVFNLSTVSGAKVFRAFRAGTFRDSLQRRRDGTPITSSHGDLALTVWRAVYPTKAGYWLGTFNSWQVSSTPFAQDTVLQMLQFLI